jgi:hypothetical protein
MDLFARVATLPSPACMALISTDAMHVARANMGRKHQISGPSCNAMKLHDSGRFAHRAPHSYIWSWNCITYAHCILARSEEHGRFHSREKLAQPVASNLREVSMLH